MQNTEISQHPKSTKMSLYVRNPAQAQTQCLFYFFLFFMLKKSTTTTVDKQHTIFYIFLSQKQICSIGKTLLKTIALEIGTI